MRSRSILVSLILMACGVITRPSSIADPDEVEIIGIPKATSLLVEPRETSDPSISDALTFTQQERQSTTSWEPYRLKRHPSAISSRKGLKVFEKLIDDSPLLRSLSSEDRSMVIENWKEKKETVISLCEESEELELIRLDLQHLVEDRSLKDHPFQNDNQFSSTSSLLKLAGKSASLIKQAKLFELGQVSLDLKLRLILDNNIKGEWLKHFPNESIEIFPSNNFWFSYSKKLWEKMEGLLFGYKHQDFTEASKSYNPVLWKYVFKTMDLWFKEGFINEESIRSAFQNSKMMKPIIYYTISCIGDTEDEDITFESVSSITQIPNWPFSKYSLDEEEEKNINANFLVEKIYHFGGMLCEELGRPFSGWQTFTQNFSHQGFHSQLQAINDSNKNSMDSIKRLKNGQGLMHPPPEGLIKNLSMILKTTLDKPLEVEPLAEEVTFSKSQLVYAIHLYLEFVERNCFHGIVQLISEDAHQKSEDFKNKHKLIVCYLKAFEATTFEHTAFKSLLDYKNSEMELHEIDLILENNHQNSKTKFSEFKNLYKSTMENPHISNWLEDQVIIGQIFQAGEAEIEANETAIQFIKDFLHEKKLRD